MNHVYRLVWNDAAQRYVPAPETAKGRGKSAGRSAVVVGLSAALLGSGAWASPVGGTVSAGSGSIVQSGTSTTITQGSQNLAINWASFGIAAGERVNFVQPNASAIALNRVTGSESSVIDGSLSANGQVWILNPNGVLFGSGASVNVGGLVASTLSLSDADFLAGNARFAGDGSQGSVSNQGSLTGGYVALLGKQVSNQGTITSANGTAALAAGDSVTLDFSGNKLLSVQVDAGTLNALAENKGLIRADNGTVILTASAKDALLDTVVNNEGVIEAKGIDTSGGTIVLLGDVNGGTVKVGGTLDASASGSHAGGFIETSGAHVQVADGTNISTLSASGKTGTWLVDPTDFTISSGSGSQTTSGIGATTLSNNLATTSVTLETDATTGSDSGDINVDAAVSWSANTTLTLNAYNDININAAITATGDSAGLVLNHGNYATAGSATSGTDYNVNAPITLSGSNATLAVNGNSYTLLRSMAELDAIDSTGLSGNYALAGDLDAVGTTYTGALVGSSENTPFAGTFAGLGHSVRNLTIGASNSNAIGLFGYTGSTSVIRDIGLVGGSVTGVGSAGGLVGSNEGRISNAYTTGTVSGLFNVGGLAGLNFGSISAAYATGDVRGNHSAGGLVGYNGLNSSIDTAYATGNISCNNYVGGLVGHNYYASIRNSYATGTVNGNVDAGGLVGNSENGSISNSYWDVSSGRGNAIGFSNGTTLSNLTAVNNSSAYSHASYASLGTWSETASGSGVWVANDGTGNTWVMIEGSTRPFLYSEYSTSIRNAHQLQLMALDPSASYSLVGDINASETSGSNASGMWTTAGFASVGNDLQAFSGSLDGAGHTVSDLTINRTAMLVGLIGYARNATVQNIGLEGGSIDSSSDLFVAGTGGLVGALFGGTVSNAYNTARVNGGEYVGGLVGFNQGIISNSYATGSVSGTSDVGGLVGYSYTGAISNSYATGAVTASGISAGGLVGSDSGGSISTSYATGSVSGTDFVGGLVGASFNDVISNVYATGDVSGNDYVGGLAGYLGNAGSISYAYATGSVSGASPVGGLVGFSRDGSSISYTYATGNVSGSANVGGLVGLSYTSNITNSYWDSSSTGQGSAVGDDDGRGTLANLNAVTSSSAYNHSSYANLGTWSETVSGSGVWVANDGSGNTWVMMEGSTRPFLYSEYSTSIDNAHQLQLMALDLTASYTLVRDIDAGETSGSNASGMWTTAGFASVGNLSAMFSGSLDGAGHTVSDLTINRTGEDNVGLFGYTASGSLINDVMLVDANVSGYGYVGALVGYGNGTISNSFASGGVMTGAYYIGGLVGENDGSVSNSHSSAAVSGISIVGGLVGDNLGTIDTSYATGTATASDNYVGGLVGYNYLNTISNSYASGAVIAANNYAGGLVGYSEAGSISNSYASGTVTGNDVVGGLVGANDSGDITNSYASGAVSGSGSAIGGLVGDNTGSVSASFWNTETSGQSSSDGGTGIATAQMMQASTFSDAGWDIASSGGSSSIWRIYEGYTAPLLRSFMTALTVTVDDVSKTYDGSTAISSSYTLSDSNADSSLLLGSASYSTSSKNVGSYSIDVDGLYSGQQGYDLSVVGTATITAATLTVSGATATNKTYDGTMAATVGGGALSGLIGSDTVVLSQNGSFSDKNVGTSKTVTIANSLSGSDAGNYIVAASSTTAAISAATLTVSGSTAANKTYDGTTAATLNGGSLSGVVSGETVTLSQSGTFSDKNASTGKTVSYTNGLSGSDASNYVLASGSGTTTADITRVALTVTANDDSRRAGGSAYSGGNGVSYSGWVNGESSSVLGGSLAYGGSAQGATHAGRYSISVNGLSADNYSLAYVDGTLLIDAASTANPALSQVQQDLHASPPGSELEPSTLTFEAPAFASNELVSLGDGSGAVRIDDCGLHLASGQACD